MQSFIEILKVNRFDIQNNLSEILFTVSFSLLAGIFCIFCLSFLGFIFHLSINIFYPIIGLIISLCLLYFLSSKLGVSKRGIAAAYLIYFVSTAIFFIISFYTYDRSFDGRTYHQLAILLLGHGWNPIYDNINQIAVKVFNYDILESRYLLFAQHYPKFSEIIQANIYILFRDIDCGKIINFYLMFSLFGYSFYVLNNSFFNKISVFKKNIISLLITLNPVSVAQFLTYCNDFYVYSFFMIMLFAIIDMEIRKEYKLSYLIIIMTSVCMINVKLGGAEYFFVLFIIYALYLLIQKQKHKLFKLTVSLAIIAVLSVLSCVNPYYTNIKSGKNILYPVTQGDKVDIVTHNIPKQFKNSFYLKNFLISSFSRVHHYPQDAPKLKFPMSIYKSELIDLPNSMIRFSGFGIFWSGIFLLSFIVASFIRFNSKESRNLGILIFSTLLILLLINPYSWWARYVHHIWTIPIFITIFILIKENLRKPELILSSLLLMIMTINILIQSRYVIVYEYNFIKQLNALSSKLQKSNEIIKIYNITDFGLLKIFEKNNLKFEFVSNNFFEKNKDSFYWVYGSYHEKYAGKMPMFWNIEDK